MPEDFPRDARKSVPAPAGYLRLLLRRFATTPELRAKLLAGTDVDEERLKDTGADVTLFTFVTFSDNLCRIIGEGWPLDALSAWGTASQGALEVAVRSAATVRESVDILMHFGHVRGPYLSVRTKRTTSKTHLIMVNTVAMSEAARRAMSETALLSATSMLGAVLEGASSELEFHFPWPEPKYAARMRTALPGAVKYGQAHCAVVLPNEVCDRASPFADPALLASALTELEHSARRIQGDDMLTLRVERLLKRRRAGRLSEEQAATELGLSRRTLVRRLAESGTTYRALLDAHLRARAEQFLSDGKLTRDQMAEALGFADPTSFSRACRRWFGRRARPPART